MHALILAAFAILYLGEEFGAPVDAGLGPWAFAWSLVAPAMIVGGVWFVSRREMRALNRDGRISRIRRVERVAGLARWLVLGAHAVGIVVFGLLTEIRSWIGDLIALDELLALTPLIVALAAIEFAMYPLERRLRDAMMIRSLDQGRAIHPFPGRFRFVWLWARHNIFFILIPLAILMGWSEGAAVLVPGSASGTPTGEAILVGLQVVGLALVFALIPPLLVRIWDTVPLPPGFLRDALEAMCRAHRVRVRDMLVWRTGGLILNGAAIGLAGPLRYIVLTDALLEQMTREQVLAVAAHEVGHMRYRHTIWLALSVLAAVLAAGTISGWAILGLERLGILTYGGGGESAAVTAALVLTLAATLAALGMVSRRFERQADAFAIRHLSGEDRGGEPVEITPESALAMAGALQRVADVHGIDVRHKAFRHGSIESRQRALMAAVGRRSNELVADRAARRARFAIIGLLVLGIALAAADVVLSGG
jgi:STE24 endopeptidase